MIVEDDKNGGIQCQVTSSTHDKKSRTNVVMKKGKYYLKHNTLQDVSIKACGHAHTHMYSHTPLCATPHNANSL